MAHCHKIATCQGVPVSHDVMLPLSSRDNLDTSESWARVTPLATLVSGGGELLLLAFPARPRPSITRTLMGPAEYFENIFTAHKIISVNTNIFSHKGFKVGSLVKIKLFTKITNYSMSRSTRSYARHFSWSGGARPGCDCHKMSQGLESS